MKTFKEEKAKLKAECPQLFQKIDNSIKKAIIRSVLVELLIVAIAYILLVPKYLTIFIITCLSGVILSLIISKSIKLFKKQYVGTVTEIFYEQRRVPTKSQAAGSTSATSMVDTTVITLVVEDSRSKNHFIELHSKYDSVYKKCDTLFFTAGISYPINLTPHDKVVCPFCGNIFVSEKPTCINCNVKILHSSNDIFS
ncbi:MAG: hypothetical protein E7642_03455 [Ruminococcaceae bacterium]|nr:hypothetical protein [Oscillospiraceae bacterium]